MGAIHDQCPNVPLVTASADVFVNGRGAGRVTDSYAGHSCFIHEPHQDHIAQGSDSVFVNGLPVARVGDITDYGGVVVEGSPDVWAGD